MKLFFGGRDRREFPPTNCLQYKPVQVILSSATTNREFIGFWDSLGLEPAGCLRNTSPSKISHEAQVQETLALAMEAKCGVFCGGGKKCVMVDGSQIC